MSFSSQASNLWSWFTPTKRNNLVLTGGTGSGDETRHNGVSLQSFLAFEHKSFIVCLCIDDTLLLLNAFYFLVTPNAAARLTRQLSSFCNPPAHHLCLPNFPFTVLLFSFHVTLRQGRCFCHEHLDICACVVHQTRVARHPARLHVWRYSPLRKKKKLKWRSHFSAKSYQN